MKVDTQVARSGASEEWHRTRIEVIQLQKDSSMIELLVQEILLNKSSSVSDQYEGVTPKQTSDVFEPYRGSTHFVRLCDP